MRLILPLFLLSILTTCHSFDLSYRFPQVQTEQVSVSFQDIHFLPSQRGYLLLRTPYQLALFPVPPAQVAYKEKKITRHKQHTLRNPGVTPAYRDQGGYGAITLSFAQVAVHEYSFNWQVVQLCFAKEMSMQIIYVPNLPAKFAAGAISNQAEKPCEAAEILAEKEWLRKVGKPLLKEYDILARARGSVNLYRGAMRKQLEISDMNLF